jgi:hypothetical protein
LSTIVEAWARVKLPWLGPSEVERDVKKARGVAAEHRLAVAVAEALGAFDKADRVDFPIS